MASARAYPPDQDYTICFRRASGDCQLVLRRSASASPAATSVGAAKGYTGKCMADNGEEKKEYNHN